MGIVAELGYVGHSLGTTGMFQLLSVRSRYSQLVRPFISLAPVAHVATIATPILQVAANTPFYIKLLGYVGCWFIQNEFDVERFLFTVN